MANITFITGNQNKADYLSKYLGHAVDHVKLNLDEIQSTKQVRTLSHSLSHIEQKKNRLGSTLAEAVGLLSPFC